MIARERHDWIEGREILQQREQLLESELREARERLGKIEDALTMIGKERADARGLLSELAGAERLLNRRIVGYESRLRRLLPRLPRPLRQRVAPLTARLPHSEETDADLAHRYQTVLGILGEIDRFDQTVTVTNELQQLADGRTAEVRAIYLGLACGFYVTVDGKSAAAGRPGKEEWTWQVAAELAAPVRRALSIHDGEEMPGWVLLPVSIKR